VRLYPFIEAEKSQHGNVKRACERLEVSRSRKRVARLMRDQGLRGRGAKRWKIA
jgi:hypothetical protein